MRVIAGLVTYFTGVNDTWSKGEIRNITVVIGRNLDYSVPTGIESVGKERQIFIFKILIFVY
jgi:hypothetical protein